MTNETPPDPGQIDLARDALALVRSHLEGDREGTALLVDQLMHDRESVAGVVGSLLAMLEFAAVYLHPMPPGEFVAAMRATLEEAGR